MKSNSAKVLVIICVLGIAGIIISAQAAKPDNKSISTPSTVTTPTPTETNESDLKATVKMASDIPGIEITNNEAVSWDSCKLILNDKWTRQISNPLEPNDPLNNPYGLFTKSDGSRFDITTTQPKNVFVACKVDGRSRTNYFVF